MEMQDAVFSLSGFISFTNPGGLELIIVFAVVLIVFGPKRLPQLARAVGKSITDFKRGLHEVKDEIEKAGEDQEGTEKNNSTDNDS